MYALRLGMILLMALGFSACGKSIGVDLSNISPAQSSGSGSGSGGGGGGGSGVERCEKLEVLCFSTHSVQISASDRAPYSLEARFCSDSDTPVTSSSHRHVRIAQILASRVDADRATDPMEIFKEEVFRKSSAKEIAYYRKASPSSSSVRGDLLMHIERDHPSCVSRDEGYGVLILDRIGQKVEMKCKIYR